MIVLAMQCCTCQTVQHVRLLQQCNPTLALLNVASFS
jgi:hypothetical protein